jgi:PAS domain S-box-containing protein
VPDELLEALRRTEFRPGTQRGPHLDDLFPPSALGATERPEPADCWDASCIHEDELVAAATIRLHPGQGFRMRDMIHTYLRLAAIIIQRLNAVAALRRSEQKLGGTLHSITDNICMLDDTCNIVWANDVALASFGPDLVGRKCNQISGGPGSLCEACPARLTFEDGESHEHEVELTLATGTRRTFWCTGNVAARHEDGRPSMVVTVLRDITEMRSLHAELERYSHDLEARVAERTHEVHFLSRIITSTVTAWVVSDVRGNLVRWNPAFEELAGYPIEDLVGMRWEDLTPAEQHETAQALVEASLGGAGHQVHEQTIRRHNGAQLLVEVRLDTLEVGEAEPVVFRIVTDISARKETERRLVEARHNAEEASRLKSEFLASISHELRTPLNGILGLANTLLKLRQRGEEAQTGDFLARIIKSGRHLQNLITEVLEISRLEAGRLSLNPEAIDPAEVLGVAENQFRGVFEEHGLTAQFNVAADTPPVWADKTRLTQILVSLLSNALKFTDPGGRVHVTVGPAADASLVEFCVSDTGHGIPEDKLEKIFGHFEQLDRSGSRLGVGLGLAICRRLTEAQQGHIWAESQVGVGSAFHVTLPAATAPITNKGTAPQARENS